MDGPDGVADGRQGGRRQVARQQAQHQELRPARQAVGHELADELADGRPGQPREPGDFGAADGAPVVQRAEDETLIVDAGLPVGRLR